MDIQLENRVPIKTIERGLLALALEPGGIRMGGTREFAVAGFDKANLHAACDGLLARELIRPVPGTTDRSAGFVCYEANLPPLAPGIQQVAGQAYAWLKRQAERYL